MRSFFNAICSWHVWREKILFSTIPRIVINCIFPPQAALAPPAGARDSAHDIYFWRTSNSRFRNELGSFGADFDIFGQRAKVCVTIAYIPLISYTNMKSRRHFFQLARVTRGANLILLIRSNEVA